MEPGTTTRTSALGDEIMAPTGIWSDGTTVWVIGPLEETAFAYTLSSGDRDSSSDIDLGSDLSLPVDLWSDGTTMWVVDSLGDKLYAYTLSGGARDTSKDIDLDSENGLPYGIWSDDTTIWVTDGEDRKVYAYSSSGVRVAGHDITLHSRNSDAGVIWGNDDTLWVANDINDVSSPFNRVFTYNNVPVTGELSARPPIACRSPTTQATTGYQGERGVGHGEAVRRPEAPGCRARSPQPTRGLPPTTTTPACPASLTFESGDTQKSFTFTRRRRHA